MIRLPGGSFQMGSPDNEQGRYDNEGPQHRVTVPSFSIGKYEITQAQWVAVMGANLLRMEVIGSNPSHFKGDGMLDVFRDALRVEQVSWNDMKEFCRRLSQMTGKQYRLPTEAEWEYACRAGTTGPYAGDHNAMAWYGSNSDARTNPVGQKKPNAFGLYDMHGNVWEMCEDVWHKSYDGTPTDGSAWLSGGDSSYRVMRGGSWNYHYNGFCRSALRLRVEPGARLSTLGFRVAVSARIS